MRHPKTYSLDHTHLCLTVSVGCESRSGIAEGSASGSQEATASEVAGAGVAHGGPERGGPLPAPVRGPWQVQVTGGGPHCWLDTTHPADHVSVATMPVRCTQSARGRACRPGASYSHVGPSWEGRALPPPTVSCWSEACPRSCPHMGAGHTPCLQAKMTSVCHAAHPQAWRS